MRLLARALCAPVVALCLAAAAVALPRRMANRHLGSRMHRAMTAVAYYVGPRPSEVAMLRSGRRGPHPGRTAPTGLRRSAISVTLLDTSECRRIVP